MYATCTTIVPAKPPKFVVDLKMDWLIFGHKRHHHANRQRSQPCPARRNFREAVNGIVTSNETIREGIETYVDYIEVQMLECSRKSDEILSALFGPATSSEARVDQLLGVAAAVAVMLVNLNSQACLDDLAKELISRYQPQEPFAIEGRDIGSVQNLVLGCIGWISMCFIPSPDLNKVLFRASEANAATRSNSRRSIALHNLACVSKRPLGALLQGWGILPIQCPPEMPYKTEPETAGITLTVASLNYFSLHNIGKLTIDWTEKLSDHCLLDSSRGELKVFRFPAFCVQAYISRRGGQILTRILQAHGCRQSCIAEMPDALYMYLYEVLLSYRLVFGENKRSRNLFRKKEALRASRGGLHDPALYILCGRKNASQITDLIPSFPDHGSFDAHTDFPTLGPRLRDLQGYIVNQKPTKWTDIWNDHRDPHQTFMFWAVVIVGGTSIILSFVQVIVSIAQLVFAVRQTRAM